MRTPSRRVALSILAAAALVLGLMWLDVLPGGWTLRGLVEDHALRRAREQREHSRERLAVFAAERVPPGAVVFLGSSTIERWPLAELFPRAGAANRGIGNEPLADLRARLEVSLPSEPAGLVLYLGSVDFRAGPILPADLAAEVAALLDELGRRLPGLPGVLLGLLPERDMTADEVERLTRTNELLAQAARERGLTFLDTQRPPLALGPGGPRAGSLSPDYSADRLHLDLDGYQVLGRWLREEGGAVAPLLAP